MKEVTITKKTDISAESVAYNSVYPAHKLLVRNRDRRVHYEHNYAFRSNKLHRQAKNM
jgi:hypothetical protein